MRLHAVPCNMKNANVFIRAHHRHHSPLHDSAFCVAVAKEDGCVCGIAICGRPACAHLEDDWAIEVRRLATDGTMNACSFLLGTCRRIAFDMGYTKIQTYTMESEGGGSLKASGWASEHKTSGRSGFSSHRTLNKKGDRQAPRRVGETAAKDRKRQQGIKVRWAAYNKRRPFVEVSWPSLPTERNPLFDEGEVSK